MELSNASKAARNQQSICNRTNVCGGIKKAGLAPTIGYFIRGNNICNSPRNTCIPKTCVVSTTIPTQRVGYRATLG